MRAFEIRVDVVQHEIESCGVVLHDKCEYFTCVH